MGKGYAASLREADVAARETLAAAGMYQSRRASSRLRPPQVSRPDRPKVGARSPANRPRDYLYTRRLGEGEEFFVAAHLILRKTAKRVYVTRKSCGPDQLGTDDERWADDEPALALDRAKLERDGSVYSSGHRLSDFFATREAALGESDSLGIAAFRVLGIHSPASVEDIKAAYRRKALDAHPDRGGSPSEFQAVEAAYRQLLREAQASAG